MFLRLQRELAFSFCSPDAERNVFLRPAQTQSYLGQAQDTVAPASRLRVRYKTISGTVDSSNGQLSLRSECPVKVTRHGQRRKRSGQKRSSLLFEDWAIFM